jgi:2-succinyl-5-enolpyruvyl-6-hydroxy-3-cyclohexene-1-carboxylate synthase
MEAHYAAVPLIAVTADRPRTFRGSGAPQSAEQVGLFSHYVNRTFDVATVEEAEAIEFGAGPPLHINVCFAEPLLDKPAKLSESVSPGKSQVSEFPRPAELATALSKIERPLLILGQLPADPFVAELVERGNCLVYAEAASQQRRPSSHILRAGAERVPTLAAEGAIDGVIRVGGVPTLRFWRDLEDRFLTLPVISLATSNFSGLARPSAVFDYNLGHLEVLAEHLENCDSSEVAKFMEEDARCFERLNALLELHPRSELGWMRWLSQNIAAQSRVFLGNSLPIREWDLAADYTERQFAIHCTRGLSGIDGQVSTFLGWAAEGSANVGIFGDLTALYDLSAPWVLRQRPDLDLKIIIINNGGGQIFERIFGNPWFLNSHALNFEHWAKLWDLDYLKNEALAKSTARRTIVEITPDAESTRAFWREHAQ